MAPAARWPLWPRALHAAIMRALVFACHCAYLFLPSHALARLETLMGTPSVYGDTGDLTMCTSDFRCPQATFNRPGYLAFGSNGTRLYISDSYNHRVRVVLSDYSPVIAPFSGNGIRGIGMDGVPATSTTMWSPLGLAVHPMTNDLFIAEPGACRVRRVSVTTGIITTFAGSSCPVAPTLPNLDNNIPATMAHLIKPQSLAISPTGIVCIVEAEPVCLVRCVDAGGMIWTLAGTANVCILAQPGGELFALDEPNYVYFREQQLYVAEANRIIAVSRMQYPTNFSTIVGRSDPNRIGFSGDGGPASQAQVNRTCAMSMDTAGHMYVNDCNNAVVRRVNASTGIIETIAGSPGVFGYLDAENALAGLFMLFPGGTAIGPDGHLYLSDPLASTVRRVVLGLPPSPTPSATASMRSTASASPSRASSWSASAIVSGSSTIFPSPSISVSGSATPSALAPDACVDFPSMSTLMGTHDGAGFAGDGESCSPGLNECTGVKLDGPSSISFSPDGLYMFVADTGNHRIRMLTISTGVVTTFAGNGRDDEADDGDAIATSTGFPSPAGIAVHEISNDIQLLVVHPALARVRRVFFATRTVQLFSGGTDHDYKTDGMPATTTRMYRPRDIAVGTTGDVCITEPDLHVVRCVDRFGVIWTSIGQLEQSGFGQLGPPYLLHKPVGIAFRGVNLTIAEPTRVLTAVSSGAGDGARFEGHVAVAGGWETGFGGNGGPGSSAVFANITNAVMDASMRIFIADAGNNIIWVHVPSECTRVIAGTVGTAGSQDATQATSGLLRFPAGMALGPDAALYIADSEAHVVRRIVWVAPSQSPTASPSMSESGTSARTASAMATNTRTSTRGSTATSSVTNSGSPSPVSSVTPLSPIATTSSLVTVAVPIMSAEMPSTTTTPSGSVTDTASNTAVPSETTSTSASSHPSSTASASHTGKASHSVSSSQSASTTTLVSVSPSPSMSPTPLAASVVFRAVPTDTSNAAMPRTIAAAMPPVQLFVTTANVRLPTALLSCTCLESTVMSVAPTRILFNPHDEQELQLTAWAVAGGRLIDAGRHLVVECRVTDPQETLLLARAQAALTFAVTAWPLYDDVIVWFDSGQALSASAWRADVSSDLLHACRTVMENCSSVSTAVRALDAVLLAARTIISSWSTANSVAAPFSQTLSTNTTMVLISRSCIIGLHVPSFSNLTAVAVGGVPCTTRVTDDGCMLAFRTPAAGALGCVLASSCGYQPLVVSNPAVGSVFGGTLSCPPFCAGANAGSVPYVVAPDEPPVPAYMTSNSAPTLLPQTPSSMGIYYTATCTDPAFTDVATGACGNESDPSSAFCAHGFADSCSPCPTGALCPGGTRLWPRRGYYAASETSGVVMPCAPPAERCAGWDRVASVTRCAPSYRTGSFGCLACAETYYAGSDGICVRCPVAKSVWERARTFAAAIGAVLLALAVLQGFVVLITKLVGGSVAGGAQRALQLAVWTMSVLQLSAQTSRSMPPGLPSPVARWNEALMNLQFEGITLPVGCDSSDPFGGPFAQLVTALCLTVLALACWACAMRGGCRNKRADRQRQCWCATTRSQLAIAWRVLVMVLVLMYPLVTNTSLQMLTCKSVELPASVYTSLSGDGSTLVHAGLSVPLEAKHYRTLVRVALLASHPNQVCYESTHLRAAVAAWLALMIYIVALPALAWWWTRVALHSAMRDYHGEVWAKALAHDAAARAAATRGTCGHVKRLWLCCIGARCAAHACCKSFHTSKLQPQDRRDGAARNVERQGEAAPSTDSGQPPPPGIAVEEHPTVGKTALKQTAEGPSEMQIMRCSDKEPARYSEAGATTLIRESSMLLTLHSTRGHSPGGANASEGNHVNIAASIPGCEGERVLDSAPEPHADWLLKPLVQGTGFRTSAYWFFLLERYAMLVSASINATFGRTSQGVDALLQPALSCTTMIIVAWLYASRVPFDHGDRWKLHVRVLSLGSVILSTTTNAVGLAAVVHPTHDVAIFVAPLAWTSACISIAVLLVLIAGFFAAVVKGVMLDARRLLTKRRIDRGKKLALRTPAAVGLPAVVDVVPAWPPREWSRHRDNRTRRVSDMLQQHAATSRSFAHPLPLNTHSRT